MDARAGDENDSPARYVGDAARAADDEPLGPRVAFEHVHADARAAVVVESGVARLPPGVEPGLGVRRFARGARTSRRRLRSSAARSTSSAAARASAAHSSGPRSCSRVASASKRVESITVLILGRDRARSRGEPDRARRGLAGERPARGDLPDGVGSRARHQPDDRAGDDRRRGRGTRGGRVALRCAALRGELGQTLVGPGRPPTSSPSSGVSSPRPSSTAATRKVLIAIRSPESRSLSGTSRRASRSVPLHALLGGAVRTQVEFSEYFAYRPGSRGVSVRRRRLLRADGRGARFARLRGQGRRPPGRGRRPAGAGGARRDRAGPSAAPRREHGLAGRDGATRARAPRAVRHRERRGAGRLVRRAGRAARVDRDPVLLAHPGRRAGGGARSARHDRRSASGSVAASPERGA